MNLEILDQQTKGYHGTSLPIAQEIIRTNFKFSAPDSGAYLGEGVYFFDNQPSQAKRWAKIMRNTRDGSAVIKSDIRYGKLLNLTDRGQCEELKRFRAKYEEKTKKQVTLPTIIDIAAERLQVECVKAIRIPQAPEMLTKQGFSPDVELILAVRNLTNILSKAIEWSEIGGPK